MTPSRSRDGWIKGAAFGLFILILAALLTLGALVFMVCVNLLTPLFSGPQISFAQSVAALVVWTMLWVASKSVIRHK